MAVPRLPGIIDSLATGFALVLRRPYLIFVPFLVDVLLWAGPGISARPVIESTSAWVLSALTLGPLTPDQLLEVNAVARQLTDSAAQWNLVGVLGWQVPNFLGLGSIGPAQPHVIVGGYASFVLLLLALALGGVLVACLFLAPLGQAVRERGLVLPSLAAGLAGLWLRLTGYLGLVVLLGLVLGLIAFLVLGLATAISPTLSALVLFLVVAAAILVMLYLFLGDEAVVVGGAGPVKAIKESVSIAARHFWSVVGLFLLVNIISQGLGVIWGKLGALQAGPWLAMLGNSFIATGLVASVMVYYWGRHPTLSGPSLSPTSNSGLTTREKDG